MDRATMHKLYPLRSDTYSLEQSFYKLFADAAVPVAAAV